MEYTYQFGNLNIINLNNSKRTICSNDLKNLKDFEDGFYINPSKNEMNSYLHIFNGKKVSKIFTLKDKITLITLYEEELTKEIYYTKYPYCHKICFIYDNKENNFSLNYDIFGILEYVTTNKVIRPNDDEFEPFKIYENKNTFKITPENIKKYVASIEDEINFTPKKLYISDSINFYPLNENDYEGVFALEDIKMGEVFALDEKYGKKINDLAFDYNNKEKYFTNENIDKFTNAKIVKSRDSNTLYLMAIKDIKAEDEISRLYGIDYWSQEINNKIVSDMLSQYFKLINREDTLYYKSLNYIQSIFNNFSEKIYKLLSYLRIYYI